MKRIFVFCFILLLVFTFTGCNQTVDSANNNQSTTKNNESTNIKNELDMQDLAQFVLTNVKFGEVPEEVDGDYCIESFELDTEKCSALCYNTSAAVADTFAIFQAQSADYVDTVTQAIQERLDYLKEGYSDYGPAEVPKIENAVVIMKGQYVILCICEENDVAADLLQDYLSNY